MNELKQLRKQYGLTQSKLASIIEVNQECISKWETGCIKINKIKFMGIKQMLAVWGGK